MSEHKRTFSRRVFLGGVTSVGVVAATVKYNPALVRSVETSLDGPALKNAAKSAASGVNLGTPVLSITVERDTDLALADLTFYGFEVDKTSTPPALNAVAQPNGGWVGVTVQLPPQAVAEAQYPTPPNAMNEPPGITYDPSPVLSAVAAPSVLAFTIPSGTVPLPTMTAADLLDWSEWVPSVAPTALYGGPAASATAPAINETAIMVPYALWLSPVIDGRSELIGLSGSFTNRFVPRPTMSPAPGVTEVWTTSLAMSVYYNYPVIERVSMPPYVGAIWAEDYAAGSIDATAYNYIAYNYYANIQ